MDRTGTASSPAVSVVIAAWNAEPFAEACLASVVHQTLRDIEIIFVNDGSTDGTLDIARSFAARDPRIRILDEPNEGDGASKNKGILLARGDYLSFLDADDVFDPDMLEASLACARRHDADIVFFGYRTKVLATGAVSGGMGVAEDCREGENLAGSQDIFSLSNPAPWNKLFKRSFIREQKLCFDRIPNCEDVKFGWCAFALARRLDCLRRDLATYQLTGQNVSASGRDSECLVDAARNTLQYLLRAGLAYRLDAFFRALAPHAVYQYRRIPQGGDCRPYLESLFSFLPGSRWKLFWQALKRFANATPGLSPFDESVLLGIRRPAVTVILHALNEEGTVGQRLESVLKQSLEDIEVLCIDGGSADATFAAMLKVSKKDARVIPCRLEGPCQQGPEDGEGGSGAGTAERLGLALARGRVCVFLGCRKAFRTPTILLELCVQGAVRLEQGKDILFRA